MQRTTANDCEISWEYQGKATYFHLSITYPSLLSNRCSWHSNMTSRPRFHSPPTNSSKDTWHGDDNVMRMEVVKFGAIDAIWCYSTSWKATGEHWRHGKCVFFSGCHSLETRDTPKWQRNGKNDGQPWDLGVSYFPINPNSIHGKLIQNPLSMPAQHSALHRCTLGSRPGRGNANLQLGADLKRSNHLALVSVHGKFATQNPSSEDPRSLFQKYETLKAQRFCSRKLIGQKLN